MELCALNGAAPQLNHPSCERAIFLQNTRASKVVSKKMTQTAKQQQVLNVVVYGAGGVGKSSLVNQYAHNSFQYENIDPTVQKNNF